MWNAKCPKCPKCEKDITELHVKAVDAKAPSGTYRGAIFACPHCKVALSAGIDPLALMIDTVKRVKSK